MHLLIRFAILVGAFALMPLIPGIKVRGLGAAIGAALVFAVVNFFIGWLVTAVLVVGTLGLALLALGFLVNVVLLWITDKLMDDLEIRGFPSLLLGALVLSAANYLSTHLHLH